MFDVNDFRGTANSSEPEIRRISWIGVQGASFTSVALVSGDKELRGRKDDMSASSEVL